MICLQYDRLFRNSYISPRKASGAEVTLYEQLELIENKQKNTSGNSSKKTGEKTMTHSLI